MYRILISIFLVSTFTTSFAQNDSTKIKWSADVGMAYSIVVISQRVEMQLGAMATINRHQFRIAPLVHLWSSEAANNPKKLAFSGVGLNYFYNLPTESPKFDLFFKYEMSFQFYNNKWEGTYYNPDISAYEQYSDKSSEFFYANSVAYGFTYKPCNSIFLRMDAGGGLYLSKIDGEYENYYGESNARYDFRGYEDFGFFLKLAFSAGYSF